jgi:hypothetical protein
MEFGDFVFATAVFFVISMFFYLIPPIAVIFQYTTVSFLLSVFIAGLVTGVIYGHKIKDSKLKSILKILVLSAVLLAFFTAIMTFKDWNTYLAAGANHPEFVETAEEFLILLPYWIAVEVCIEWVIGGPFAFVGLFIGSKVREMKSN